MKTTTSSGRNLIDGRWPAALGRPIRRRDFASHGDWMMRAYAIGLGAGTQVFTHLPWFILADGWPGASPSHSCSS